VTARQRIGAFAVLLALALGAGYAAGRAIDPADRGLASHAPPAGGVRMP
jgi:hypothetical protein